MEYLNCCFCHVTYIQPVVELQCNHTICQPCFQYINMNNQELFKCPLDGVEIYPDKAAIYLSMKHYLSQLYINCTNENCEWKGTATQLEVHCEECPYQVLSCPNNNCNIKFIKSLSHTHDMECLFKEVKCDNCCHTVYQKDESLHKELCIVNLTMTCKNDGCTSEFSYSEKQKHYNEICEYQKVSCSIGQCKSVVLRKDLENHVKLCAYNEKVICSNEKCVAVVVRKNLAKHLKECLYEYTTCTAPSCQLSVLRIDLPAHLDLCPNVKIQCTSSECYNRFRRSYLAQHLLTCVHVVLECEYCGIKHKRYESMNHLKECSSEASKVKCEACGLLVGNHPQFISEHSAICKQQKVTCMKCNSDLTLKDFQNHASKCPKEQLACLYGCNKVFTRDELSSHVCAVPLEGCRYEKCDYKGTKSECTIHEENCNNKDDYANNNNNNIIKKKKRSLEVDFETITTTSDINQSEYRTDRIEPRIDEYHHKKTVQIIADAKQDNKDYSYGRFVWEYETAGIQIADDVIEESALPGFPKMQPFVPKNNNALQYDGSILPLKSPKRNSPLNSPITPYHRLQINRHSSPYVDSVVNKVPNTFLTNWKEFDELKNYVKLQEQEIIRLKQGSYNILKTVEQMKADKSILCNELKYLRFMSQCYVGNNIVWEIDNFACKLELSRSQNKMVEGHSPVFYTGNPGYKCISNVYMYHQSESYKGLHIGFTILKGKYDSILSWPFKQKVQMTILNQHGMGNESLVKVVNELSFDKASRPLEFDNDEQVIDFLFYEELVEFIFNDSLFLQCSIS